MGVWNHGLEESALRKGLLSDETVAGNAFKFPTVAEFSGAIKTAEVRSADNRELYADTLYYEDCGNNACTPQYNGNISRMAHHLVHGNGNYGEFRNVQYTYDELNRLTKVDDLRQDVFDEIFAYDAQGRIAMQRRGANTNSWVTSGGEYTYKNGTNKLISVANEMGGTSASGRIMSDPNNFVYDSEGNLTEDKSKDLKILYDWRGMPIEFIQEPQPTGSSDNSLFRLTMAYDGSGRRISKTRWVKKVGSQDWEKELVTHYTGIGTEIRENIAGPVKETKVVVNMPSGLGRYGIEDAENPDMGSGVGYIPNTKFEWYLKNHLGSTMLVYGTQADANPAHSDIGTPLAAYDYRAFGEMVELTPPPTGKVTENFTGKERDDEIALNYFGARYLDPMLGMWVSVDPARQFSSPYLYAGNGYNPVNIIDPDGNDAMVVVTGVANSERSKAWSGAYKRNYEFNRYRVDVYLNTEKWKSGQTYKDVEPSKSYWGTRDAWHPDAKYNKAIISGSGFVKYSDGPKANAHTPPWLIVVNKGTSTFVGKGPKGETTWEGESIHGGAGPANSESCITFTTKDWHNIRADLVPDLDAENPVKIEFEPFTPEEKSWEK